MGCDARELGARELGARELGARELGARELGARELGARELGARELGGLGDGYNWGARDPHSRPPPAPPASGRGADHHYAGEFGGDASHYLGETFSIAGRHCRLLAAEATLTEPAGQHRPSQTEDLHVVDTRWTCDDGRPRPPLPQDGTRMVWLDAAGRPHTPSPRTELGRRAPDHVVFEIAEGSDGLPRQRRYDAQTGEPVGSRTPHDARLAIEHGDERVLIAPWPRMHDRTLDLFLDRLARTLASEVSVETLSETTEGHEALLTAADLYHRARALFSARLLVVRSIEDIEGQPRITLTLGESTLASTVVRFSFELSLASGHPTLLRLIDPASARRQIECAEAKQKLALRAEQVGQPKQGTGCNVLSVLLPTRCGEADPSLVSEALAVGTRCGDFGEVGLEPYGEPPAPSDFELTLRRGRPASSLDRAPRYTLTLDRRGRVRFEGQHWVSAQGPSEGRTSERLLGALYAMVQRLGWFERPARPDSRRCAGDETRGDLITVRAGGRVRAVRDRDGCRGEFGASELATLRSAIERVAAVEVWTAPSSELAERDAQIWLIAAE